MQRSSHGYTLIELLLYIAISSSILLALAGFFGMSISARVKNQSIAEVNQQGSFLLETIATAVRNSTAITAPAVGGSAGMLSITTTANPATFSVTDGTLNITEGTAAPVALSSSQVQVSDLIFKNLSRAATPGLVQVSFTVGRSNPNNQSEYEYRRTFTTSIARRLP